MILRRKRSSRDHRRYESVCGRIVHHDARADGYIYVEASRNDVIRGLIKRGFVEYTPPPPATVDVKSKPKKKSG